MKEIECGRKLLYRTDTLSEVRLLIAVGCIDKPIMVLPVQ